MKKAQGMSVNTIVIAIIVLVVLIVLILVYTGYFGSWTGATRDCASQGGKCVGDETCGSGEMPMRASCPDAEDICCSLNKVVNYE